jgi:hypothetical protein
MPLPPPSPFLSRTAVEASDVADRARTLLTHNGLGDRITVVKGKVEEVTLPEKVRAGVGVGGAG